jgi:hypothetical protein
MSPKLGQKKMDSLHEDRNYVVVMVDLHDSDVDEVEHFAEYGDANERARALNALHGHGTGCVHAVMNADEFDALED